jgi:hypothetical protein
MATNIKDLGPKDVIQCQTSEDADAIVKLMSGWNWRSTYWHMYEKNTCYRPATNQYSSKKFYKAKGYTIYPASNFIG